MAKIIMRHGETQYEQGKVSLEEAVDITEEGVQNVLRNTHRMVPFLEGNPYTIQSSPYGRALASAKVTDRLLQGYGLESRGIVSNDQLREVDFDFQIFQAFVLGGRLDEYGIDVDVARTNPQFLPWEQYFHEDAIHNLEPSITTSFPEALLRNIAGWERAHDAGSRLIDEINAHPDNTIFVTHEGPAWGVFSRTGAHQHEYLERSHFMVVDNADGYNVPIYLSQHQGR